MDFRYFASETGDDPAVDGEAVWVPLVLSFATRTNQGPSRCSVCSPADASLLPLLPAFPPSADASGAFLVDDSEPKQETFQLTEL